MIALRVSAIGGPISLIISGCLGGSGFGTGSHSSRYARRRFPKALPGK